MCNTKARYIAPVCNSGLNLYRRDTQSIVYYELYLDMQNVVD